MISPKPCSAAKICLLSARFLGGGFALMWIWEESRVRVLRAGLLVILRAIGRAIGRELEREDDGVW